MAARAKVSQTVKAQLKQICALIAREFQPERIILFGSQAYGKPTPGSDLDLLVVMHFTGDPLEQAVTILRKLNLMLPIDLLVKTPEQVQQRLTLGDRFMREIIERGKVLYEAPIA
ncbi:MAG: nucleotidyltransferase domain-containing protein [Acidobacteria bacterium]|nr:nucleotidyltransferase domain-containing protein [Acidobacteriota bacterium]MBI3421454.1 nucleotidyltransferase domain-containing protein [Acidobacteriota bacterium]